MNQFIFEFFYSFAHRSNVFDSIIYFLASDYGLIILTVLLIYLFKHKDKLKRVSDLIIVLISGVTAVMVADILKLFFHTLRPFEIFPWVHALIIKDDFSFPSGHSAFFMAIATSLWFYHKRLSVFFGISAVVIGLSRVIAGIHFPIDILGGLTLGFLVGIIIPFIINKLKNLF